MVGPTTLDDLNYPKLMQCVKGSTQFFIRFFKDEQKGSPSRTDVVVKDENGGTITVKTDECPDEDFRGYVFLLGVFLSPTLGSLCNRIYNFMKICQFFATVLVSYMIFHLSRHIEIRFNSISEAEKCVETLKSFREGLTAKRITYEYTKGKNDYLMRFSHSLPVYVLHV